MCGWEGEKKERAAERGRKRERLFASPCVSVSRNVCVPKFVFVYQCVTAPLCKTGGTSLSELSHGGLGVCVCVCLSSFLVSENLQQVE